MRRVNSRGTRIRKIRLPRHRIENRKALTRRACLTRRTRRPTLAGDLPINSRECGRCCNRQCLGKEDLGVRINRGVTHRSSVLRQFQMDTVTLQGKTIPGGITRREYECAIVLEINASRCQGKGLVFGVDRPHQRNIHCIPRRQGGGDHGEVKALRSILRFRGSHIGSDRTSREGKGIRAGGGISRGRHLEAARPRRSRWTSGSCASGRTREPSRTRSTRTRSTRLCKQKASQLRIRPHEIRSIGGRIQHRQSLLIQFLHLSNCIRRRSISISRRVQCRVKSTHIFQLDIHRTKGSIRNALDTK